MVSRSSFITWGKAKSNVLRLQRRVFKSVYVGDFFYALKIQKLIIISSSARLMSIRYSIQNFKTENLFGQDNKVTLNFLEKFRISNFLLHNANNWIPENFKDITLLDSMTNEFFNFRIWSLSDCCWQNLVNFAIEPAYQAIMSPRNFSFNGLMSVYNMQKVILLNLGKQSYGLQKRVLIICFQEKLLEFDNSILLRKILAPRSIKLGIFRFLKLGLYLGFSYKTKKINALAYLLVNILLNEIDYFSNSVRVGSNILVFLKPNENEYEYINKLFSYFLSIGIDGVRVRINS